jgi:alpha-beta hydrolase superfamily lysophospholipase
MATRKEMILALTKHELVFVSGLDADHEWFEHTAQFFANGGFTTYTHDHLNQQYVLKIEEEKSNESN